MSDNKPTFTTKVKQAKRELKAEEKGLIANKIIRTSISMDAQLLFKIKQMALKRKMSEAKPDTVTGIIKEALNNIVKQEL